MRWFHSNFITHEKNLVIGLEEDLVIYWANQWPCKNGVNSWKYQNEIFSELVLTSERYLNADKLGMKYKIIWVH